MQIKYVKFIEYYQDNRKGVPCFQVIGVANKPGGFDWSRLVADGLEVGDWTLRGITKKDEKGQWCVVEPFVAKKNAKKKTVDLTPEKIEKLCNLAEDSKGLARELERLIGTEGVIFTEESGSVYVNIETGNLGLTVHYNLGENGEYVPERLTLSDYKIGSWCVNFGSFNRLGEEWEVYPLILTKELEVEGGIVKESYHYEAEVEKLLPAFTGKLNAIAKEVLKLAHSEDTTQLYKAIENLRELENIPRKGEKMLTYRTKDLFLTLTKFEEDTITWTMNKEGRKITWKNFPEQVGQELLDLMEEAIETGGAERLQSYCEKLLKEKVQTTARRR